MSSRDTADGPVCRHAILRMVLCVVTCTADGPVCRHVILRMVLCVVT